MSSWQHTDIIIAPSLLASDFSRIKEEMQRAISSGGDWIHLDVMDGHFVDNISFGLEYGECFALLGVSGAGKTTCFKSLTGEIYPTRGSVTINGYDITTAGGF